ncbi:hypothetical protein COV61_05200, partial [Candidatus Micrarchaeota archaeon CG11_big_fil_rev_8_21_14_0_20_47_5]
LPQPGKKGKMPSQPANQVVRMALFAAIAVIAVLALVILWIGSYGPVSGAQAQGQAEYSPFLEFGVENQQVLNFGDSKNLYTIYFEIPFTQRDVSSATIRAKYYSEKLPSQIFVLQTPRQQAESYPEFRKSLEKQLSGRGLSVSDISIEQLKSLPPSTLVIIPSGYFPQSLLEGDFTYAELLRRQTVILYMGFPLEQMLSENGYPVATPANISSTLPFSFSGKASPSTDGFNLFDPLYSATSKNQQAVLPVWGSVSAVKMDSGYILFLPQTLDGGWSRNGTAAAMDVSRLVFESPWQPPLSISEIYLDTANTTSGRILIFSNPISRPEVFIQLYAEGVSPDSKTYALTKQISVKKAQNSDIYIKGGSVFLPTYLTGQKIRLTLDFKEPAFSEKKLFLQTVLDGQAQKSERIQEGLTSLQSQIPFDYDSSLPPGKYILRVVDSAGKMYSQAIGEIADFQVVSQSADFKKGNFQFGFTSPIASQINFTSLHASVDGKFLQEIPAGSTANYFVPNLASGPHTFYFEFEGGYGKSILLDYRVQKQFYDNPIVVFLGIITLVFFVVGTFMRRPERELYYLDVPDFPPISAIKVPVGKASVLSLFDKINKNYSWERMPLSLDELKGGFSSLRHNGKPIVVGSYNLERVLSKIQGSSGEIKEVFGLWGMRRWEEESGRSLKNLSMFRLIRDVFVNRTVPFLRPKEKDGPDAKIKISKTDYNIYLFEDESSAARALSTLDGAPSIIVFERKKEISDFCDRLVSTDETAVRLKLEISSERVFLVSLEELGAFI